MQRSLARVGEGFDNDRRELLDGGVHPGERRLDLPLRVHLPRRYHRCCCAPPRPRRAVLIAPRRERSTDAGLRRRRPAAPAARARPSRRPSCGAVQTAQTRVCVRRTGPQAHLPPEPAARSALRLALREHPAVAAARAGLPHCRLCSAPVRALLCSRAFRGSRKTQRMRTARPSSRTVTTRCTSSRDPRAGPRSQPRSRFRAGPACAALTSA
jgi:hypothetical protein